MTDPKTILFAIAMVCFAFVAALMFFVHVTCRR